MAQITTAPPPAQRPQMEQTALWVRLYFLHALDKNWIRKFCSAEGGFMQVEAWWIGLFYSDCGIFALSHWSERKYGV